MSQSEIAGLICQLFGLENDFSEDRCIPGFEVRVGFLCK